MVLSTLQHLCLNRIAKDIKMWCDNSCGDMSQYLYMLGPFDNLGSRQIQELLNILVKNKQFKTAYLHTLLHCGLTSLDLSTCCYLVSDSFIKIITRRCQKIIHLVMQNCGRVSSRALQELTLNLPNLRSLNLSGCTLCNNDVLINLGKNCKDLHVLKLDSCKKVTDLGIKGLCDGMNAATNCSNMVEINLSSTGITSEGVLYLLRKEPYLQCLSLSTCLPSSNHKTEMFFNDSYLSVGVTNLKYVDLSNTSINDSTVANICKICPYLSSLILTGCSNLTGLCLIHLKPLQDLKHLQLDASGIDCSRELTPFLKECGYHLETLHLPMSCNLDLQVIGQYCHNLTNLSLVDSTSLSGSFIDKNNRSLTLFEACPHLKCLNLQNCKFSENKSFSDQLSSIFCTLLCDLEILNLSGVEDLEHGIIWKFIESTGFTKLRVLDISRCPLVTNELVFLLVNSCKNLQCLNVSDCWKVNRCDIEVANQLVKTSGVNMDITWT